TRRTASHLSRRDRFATLARRDPAESVLEGEEPICVREDPKTERTVLRCDKPKGAVNDSDLGGRRDRGRDRSHQEDDQRDPHDGTDPAHEAKPIGASRKTDQTDFSSTGRAADASSSANRAPSRRNTASGPPATIGASSGARRITSWSESSGHEAPPRRISATGADSRSRAARCTESLSKPGRGREAAPTPSANPNSPCPSRTWSSRSATSSAVAAAESNPPGTSASTTGWRSVPESVGDSSRAISVSSVVLIARERRLRSAEVSLPMTQRSTEIAASAV